MHFGNVKVEFVWPGLFWAVPAFALLIVLPAILIFSLFKYTSMSKVKKLALTPICVFSPLLVTSLWPLILSLSGLVIVSDSNGSQRADWQTTADIFGDYSVYVWTVPTCLLIYLVFINLRSGYKRISSVSDQNSL
jgi:hypothetical protein